MSAVANVEKGQALAALNEGQLIAVLKSSLYPGASDDSVKMVLSYCQAAKLDPMQKPVHIVPMFDRKSGEMRDVIMPGIGLYRTNASRTGQFAEMSDPDFGPDVNGTLGGQAITYPEWCRVTVKRALSSGIVAEFTAKEFWIENYAVKGGKEKSIAPNSMWMRRPRGQLGKCASAQAMRIAFPELGAQATADEMEGKPLEERDMGAADVVQEIKNPTLETYTDERFDELLKAWTVAVQSGKTTPERVISMVSSRAVLSEEQKKKIRAITTEKAPADVSDFVEDYAEAEQKGVA